MAFDAVFPESDAWPSHDQSKDTPTGDHVTKDYFVVRDGTEFAGTHVIVDLWDADGLDSLERMEAAFREMIEVCGATLLHIHLHHFTPNDGISGVAVLAESHISVHTWPERRFAAFDIFMCGGARPELAVGVLKHHFSPQRIDVNEIRRGTVSNDAHYE